jgi:hypothetical protein
VLEEPEPDEPAPDEPAPDEPVLLEPAPDEPEPEALGMLDDELGELEEPVELLEPVEPDVLLPVDGDALGVELLLDVADALETPSLLIVSESRRPLAFRPSFFWNSRRADMVFGPILPSMSPGSMPLSLSACCTALTCSGLPPPLAM